jgi:hypothetical protein
MPAVIYPAPFSDVNNRLNFANAELHAIKRALKAGENPDPKRVQEAAQHYTAIGAMLATYTAPKAKASK